MAAPSYTTDLATHTDCSSVTGFAEATGFADTDGTGEVDTDLAIYGSSCISESQRKSGKGSLIYTGTARTLPTHGGFFIWYKFFAPNALLSKASGGLQAFVGSNSSNFRQYYVNGSDEYSYGGWKNYFIDPTEAANNTTGSPGTTYASAGIGVDLSAGISKGNSHTIDHIRWGRGEVIITAGDLANGYATFDGLAVVNDNATTGRWGLFQDVGGSYLWKGLMSLGTSGTAVDFRDSNVVINIDNTEFADVAFNRIEVTNTGSNIEWTSVLISALGTQSKGEFEMINGATLDFTNCTFSDMSTFIFNKGTGACDITGSTFRKCGQVTQGGATFDGCVFAESAAAVSLVVDDISLVTGNTFISDGSNHAVNLGTGVTTQSITWDNQLSGYVASGESSTGNEAILVNVAASNTLTINVASGASTPSYYNTGTGNVVIVSGAVDVTVTTVLSDGTPVGSVPVLVLAANGTGPFPFDETVTITNSGTTATVSHTAHGMSTGDKVMIKYASLAANNGTFAITVTGVNGYTYTMGSTPGTNPTGTIKATFAALEGISNATTGVLTTSRSYPSNQPISGRARKASGSPFYKTAPIAGTISSATGFDGTAIMILDE